MLKRGWTDKELVGLMGGKPLFNLNTIKAQRVIGNFMRIMDKVDGHAKQQKSLQPANDLYKERPDLPFKGW